MCYAHEDSEEVYPEMAWMRDQGANLWYDEGISAGKNWRTAIGDSLRNASHILFYVSAGSLKSDHCNREINLALDEGKEVVTVYIEDVELTTDLKVGLNRVQALHRDKDASYQQHLLNTLGVSLTTPAELQSKTALSGRHNRFPRQVGVLPPRFLSPLTPFLNRGSTVGIHGTTKCTKIQTETTLSDPSRHQIVP